MRFFISIFLLIVYIPVFSQPQLKNQDSLRVEELNRLGYEIRLTDPDQSIEYGQKAFNLASKINFKDGIAEAYRVIGIGNYYLGKSDTAIAKYLTSLSIYQQTHNLKGQAKIYNNIGNLYREIDYDKGLLYFKQALSLAKELDIKDLIAGSNLNIGNIYTRKKNYTLALRSYQESYRLFLEINNPIGITQCLHNQGVIYYNLHQAEKAKKLLLLANHKAKENELNNTVASINLTLTAIFIGQREYNKAEEYLIEGQAYAQIVKDTKLEQDYLKTYYELEAKRENYKQALFYLKQVYKQDSVDFKELVSRKFGLFEEQQKFLEKEKETLVLLERQKTNRVIYWATVLVLGLACVVISLLIMNVKKKAKTNKKLQELNDEISIHTRNLDQANHTLEATIEERTKDLQVKNRKLSEYSSHLSHEIRSPIATMKGLLVLEREKLIEDKELIKEVEKCVNDIDDKIMNINKMLHSSEYKGLSSES